MLSWKRKSTSNVLFVWTSLRISTTMLLCWIVGVSNFYHNACIWEWLWEKRYFTCPICRFNFATATKNFVRDPPATRKQNHRRNNIGVTKPDRATAKARLGRRKTDRITTIKITSFWLTNARKPKKYWIVECPQLLYNCVKLKMSDLHSRLWEAYLEYSFMHALRNYSLQLMSNYCHSFSFFSIFCSTN